MVRHRYPVEISLSPEDRLEVVWDDQHRTSIPIRTVRDYCPCATCRKARLDRADAAAEPGKRRTLNVLGVNTRYDIAGLEHVGRYGLGVNWKDDHRSIFTFEYLADICPCDDCARERGGPPLPFDPLGAG